MSKLIARAKELGSRRAMVAMLTATFGVAALLHLQGGTSGQVLGCAEVVRLDVTSTELGRGKTVNVDVGALVHSGDVTGTANTVIDGVVVARSRRVKELPHHCRSSLRVPSRGREVRVAPAGSCEILPGQSFQIDFGAPAPFSQEVAN